MLRRTPGHADLQVDARARCKRRLQARPHHLQHHDQRLLQGSQYIGGLHDVVDDGAGGNQERLRAL